MQNMKMLFTFSILSSLDMWLQSRQERYIRAAKSDKLLINRHTQAAKQERDWYGCGQGNPLYFNQNDR